MPGIGQKNWTGLQENGRKLFEILGVERAIRKENAHRLSMFRFFDAPQGIYLTRTNPKRYSIFDAGLLARISPSWPEEKASGPASSA